MILIVGLGNVGPQYARTRHNIGFMVVDQLATDWNEESHWGALVSKTVLEGQEIILVKPTTMMNQSGIAVSRLAQQYKIAPEDIWVIYDELDLPFGRVKISTGRGDNGHNGTKSIVASLGHNRFWRFRVGVDSRQHREIPGLEYVLKPIHPTEQQLLDASIDQAVAAIKTALASTPLAAMQEYNKPAAKTAR